MSDHPHNVLFLCTGNSARSILAEAILNRVGQGRFKAFSAGSQPKGEVHPYALDLLKSLNHDTSFARSKNWEEFAVPGAPEMNFVDTVCDNAANESGPVGPGQPMTAPWGVPDAGLGCRPPCSPEPPAPGCSSCSGPPRPRNRGPAGSVNRWSRATHSEGACRSPRYGHERRRGWCGLGR